MLIKIFYDKNVEETFEHDARIYNLAFFKYNSMIRHPYSLYSITHDKARPLFMHHVFKRAVEKVSKVLKNTN